MNSPATLAETRRRIDELRCCLDDVRDIADEEAWIEGFAGEDEARELSRLYEEEAVLERADRCGVFSKAVARVP